MNNRCAETDRELYRERPGDYYADSIHVTASGGIGINCGGSVIVKPLREWFKAVAQYTTTEPPLPHATQSTPSETVEPSASIAEGLRAARSFLAVNPPDEDGEHQSANCMVAAALIELWDKHKFQASLSATRLKDASLDELERANELPSDKLERLADRAARGSLNPAELADAAARLGSALLKATPSATRSTVIEECAALCDALKERSSKAFYGPGMEHLHPQVKGEWEAAKVLGEQIRALKNAEYVHEGKK